MGVPGPGGPCSEIYYDRGPEYGREGGPVADEDRYLEIWNLVFMQDVRGDRSPKDDFPLIGALPKKNIDTGMGVERVAFLLQGVDNVYETDLVRPVIARAEEFSGRRYGADHGRDDVRFRVIADHARSGVDAHRRRRDPVQRGPRLRAAPAAAPDRALGPAARRARAGAAARSPRSCATRWRPSYPELATDFERISAVIAAPRRRRSSQTLATGSKIFDTAVADDQGGRRRRSCRATRRSSCTTPTASRSTSRWRWPPRQG